MFFSGPSGIHWPPRRAWWAWCSCKYLAFTLFILSVFMCQNIAYFTFYKTCNFLNIIIINLSAGSNGFPWSWRPSWKERRRCKFFFSLFKSSSACSSCIFISVLLFSKGEAGKAGRPGERGAAGPQVRFVCWTGV